MNGLLVYGKMEQILYRVYPTLKNFPKSEKYSLCSNIKNEMFEVLKNITLASTVKSKRVYYSQEADGHLQILKVLINLSYNNKYISKGFWQEISLELSEVGRMLSGLIKSNK